MDVNVHPTKREVHFLNEDLIVERISDSLQEKLAGQSQSRTFEYQVEFHSFTSVSSLTDPVAQTLLTGRIAEPDHGSKKRKGKERERNEEHDNPEGSTPSSPAREQELLFHYFVI